jgi:hypothetical protein
MRRRTFIKGSAAAGAGMLGTGRPAAGAAAGPAKVPLSPEIEPLVRLLEETPRDRVLESVGKRIHAETTYEELLAAVLLAGVRNVQPRPSVGFKFHAVLGVNSAHLAALNAAHGDRWLPIFWAIDSFKDSQARDVREGNWTMGPVNETAVPPAHRAEKAFTEAMDRWQEEEADAAAAGLARTQGASRVFELLWRYGARDYRSIGHKAIFVANSWRTLQVIGWRHAEPVVRSIAYALLNHGGENPATTDDPADRPWRRNQKLVKTIRREWQDGRADAQAITDLLAALREGSDSDAADNVVAILNRGVAPQSIWDAIFAGAAELVLRKPGIISLHAVTTTNAVHVAYQMSERDETRRLLLLQNAAFLPLFRDTRGGGPPVKLSALQAAAPDKDVPSPSEILSEAGRDRKRATQLALGYLQKGGDPRNLVHAARNTVILKGRGAHDYKYASAALEDYLHISPPWRERYLATSLLLVPPSTRTDNPLIERARAVLSA